MALSVSFSANPSYSFSELAMDIVRDRVDKSFYSSANKIIRSIQTSFKREGRRGSLPKWKPTSMLTIRFLRVEDVDNGATLVDTGRMRDTIEMVDANFSGKEEWYIKINAKDGKKAKLHQEGGTSVIEVRSHKRNYKGREIITKAYTKKIRVPQRRFLEFVEPEEAIFDKETDKI